MDQPPAISSLLDTFIPHPDVRRRHEIVIRAPAAVVLEAARNFDVRSLRLVRLIFWLRAKILGSHEEEILWSQGFVQEMLRLGWGVLAEDRNRWLVAGAVCQPWLADVVFTPIRPGDFAAYAEPDSMKVLWTLETEPLDEACSRFATETRAVGTDAQAQAKFRDYWRRFGGGAMVIRWLFLMAIRRNAERRWRADGAGTIGCTTHLVRKHNRPHARQRGSRTDQGCRNELSK
jgi:hypothetical protein